METTYHIPVMLEPTIDALHLKEDGIYVDATFGGGGHSREILNRLGTHGRLFGFDQDTDAQANIPSDTRFTFVHGNFRFVSNYLRYHGVTKVDGIIADLGVSSHHFDDETRGFSFRFSGPLDMRMNKNAHISAADIVNIYTDEQLISIFRNYGELNQATRIAKAIINARNQQPIHTIEEFLPIINPFVSPKQSKKELAQIFQALRIEVNQEMVALQQFLQQAPELLSNNGHIAILTYHSLEDRLVKNFFKAGNFDGKIEKDFYGNILAPLKASNKALVATDEEIALNPRSRSAKLRVATKE